MLFEYIWIDGTLPTAELRSKTMVGDFLTDEEAVNPTGCHHNLPKWKFDGSSTYQAFGRSSDCVLSPVRIFKSPFWTDGFLVLCETSDFSGKALPSNTRRNALEVERKAASHVPWCAFEQEYTLLDRESGAPLGFSMTFRGREEMSGQGKYYCSVGVGKNFGRAIAEEHLQKCLEAGVKLTGINSEVMPGQWEFQVGGPHVSPLEASDHLWVARWILHRVTEKYDVVASLDPKPLTGDWNGAGAHTNFSTKATRSHGGIVDLIHMCEKLKMRATRHLDAYGDGIERRLTGAHETCSYKEFKWGIADRTASVRIPGDVEKAGCGYLEDRRPNANCDPYQVVALMVETCCLWSPPPVETPIEVTVDDEGGSQQTSGPPVGGRLVDEGELR